jgi:hypothetical protein
VTGVLTDDSVPLINANIEARAVDASVRGDGIAIIEPMGRNNLRISNKPALAAERMQGSRRRSS